MATQQDKVSEVVAIANVNGKLARQLLKAHAWDVQLALQTFFAANDADGDGADAETGVEQLVGDEPDAATSDPDNDVHDDELSIEDEEDDDDSDDDDMYAIVLSQREDATDLRRYVTCH